jgi:hypothetical protein
MILRVYTLNTIRKHGGESNATPPRYCSQLPYHPLPTEPPSNAMAGTGSCVDQLHPLLSVRVVPGMCAEHDRTAQRSNSMTGANASMWGSRTLM